MAMLFNEPGVFVSPLTLDRCSDLHEKGYIAIIEDGFITFLSEREYQLFTERRMDILMNAILDNCDLFEQHDRERNSGKREVQEKLNGPGRIEIGTGVFVPEEDAFDYALERCFEIVPNFVHRLKWTDEFKKMLVQWFYSGNWVKVDERTD
ncbi:MAG: hypothetical protein HFI70_03890 [Lachnospiraceae bacterium]|nr:hypothetical protein [Lachnospiraceae bacterium]